MTEVSVTLAYHVPQLPQVSIAVLGCQIVPSHSSTSQAETFGASWCLGVFVDSLLDGVVNRNMSKGVLAPNLDRKATLYEVGMHFRVFDEQSRHRSIVIGQEPGVVHLVIGEAPWDHLSDCCKMKHPVASLEAQMRPSMISAMSK